MSSQMVREMLCEGVYLNTITDVKFKSNRISCNLVLPLDEATVADTAVVPFVLRKRFRDCPDFTRLNERLCELYGAALDADVRKYGAYQILNVSIQSLDDRYTLENEPIVAECAKLASNLLLDPYFVDGVFDERDFALEKQYLIDTIESEINDKRDYAVSRCQSLLFAGEPFAIKKYGTKAAAEKITPQSATKAYHEAVKKAVVEIMFIGCGDSSGAAKIFKESFQRQDRAPFAYKDVPTKHTADQVTEHIQHMDVSQSKLVMGFRVGELANSDEANASKMMSALFGGTPFSRLFLNVREKYSLCYYCVSRFDKATGTLLVDSGVEEQNKQKAQDEILKQLEIVRQGEFEQEELDNTLLALINALKSTSDTLGGMENWYLTQILGGTNQSPTENAEQISHITKEDIMRAAQRVTLDTVYFLTGKEGQPNE